MDDERDKMSASRVMVVLPPVELPEYSGDMDTITPAILWTSLGSMDAPTTPSLSSLLNRGRVAGTGDGNDALKANAKLRRFGQ